MFSVIHYTADNTRTAYGGLTQEEAESLFREFEDILLQHEQVIMLHGMTFIMSATKR